MMNDSFDSAAAADNTESGESIQDEIRRKHPEVLKRDIANIENQREEMKRSLSAVGSIPVEQTMPYIALGLKLRLYKDRLSELSGPAQGSKNSCEPS